MKLRLTGYTFDASEKTIVHSSFSDITLAGIQLIVNVTDQIIIYNFADTAKGGTLATDTLTLEHDTTSMSDTDELMIIVENGASTLTIAGTVDLGATDNAVLDAIAASVAAIDTDTTTVIGHLDGVEGLLTTIDGDTGNISTKIDILAGAVSGTEMQVDVLTMPTTTVQATNLDIRDLTNADVVTAELSAVDNAVLDTIDAVLDTIKVDTEAIETAVEAIQAGQLADGHNVTIDNASGAAAVNIQDGGNTITVDGTVAVTNAGLTELAAAINSDKVDVNIASSAVSFGGTSAADDADFTDGTTPGTPAMGVYEATPTTVTDGDLGVVGITETRQLRVAADQEGAWTVDLGATDNAVLDAIAASTAAIDTDTTTIIGHLDGVETLLGTIDADTGGILTATQLLDDTVQVLGTDTYTEATSKGITLGAVRRDADTTLVGTTNEFGPLQMDANGRLKVEVFSGETLPVSGTVTVTATNLDVQSGGVDLATSAQAGGIQSSLEIMDNAVYQDDADWTADASYHTLVGAVTQATPSANTDGDTTPLITNALRELRIAVPESDLATAATSHVKKYYTNAGAVTDGIVWSPAAGKRWYVTDIFINVSAAATVTLEDDLSGGDSAVWKAELAANSGWSHHFGTPLFSGEDAADLIVTTSAGNVYITVTGYEI